MKGCRAASTELGDLRELVGQGRREPGRELGVYAGGVGLVVHRVQQRPHPRPACFRDVGHQVRRVMREAALPAGSGQDRADRVDHAAVSVGGDQPQAAAAAAGQSGPSRPLVAGRRPPELHIGKVSGILPTLRGYHSPVTWSGKPSRRRASSIACISLSASSPVGMVWEYLSNSSLSSPHSP